MPEAHQKLEKQRIDRFPGARSRGASGKRIFDGQAIEDGV
jgi:hypothetical protein